MSKKWVKKLDKLYYRKDLMIEYLKDRIDESDWHACWDASVEIYKIEEQIKILEAYFEE